MKGPTIDEFAELMIHEGHTVFRCKSCLAVLWLEADDPVAVAEACAQENVFLVPLSGGVRIGLCAVNCNQMDQVASALAKAIR